MNLYNVPKLQKKEQAIKIIHFYKKWNNPLDTKSFYNLGLSKISLLKIFLRFQSIPDQ